MIMKIILAFIDPLFISIILLILTLVLYKKHKKKWFIYIYLCIFYFLNTSVFSETLLYHFERQFPKIDSQEIQDSATIFVFGGGAFNDPNLPISSRAKNESTIRLIEAILIANSSNTIILSGKDGFTNSSEARSIYEIAKRLNPNIKYILDEKSTNTGEQVTYVSKLKYKQIILVSSASHIPRINMLAKRHNIRNYLLAPTEYKIKELQFEIYDFIPNAKASNYMRLLIYELSSYLYFFIIK